ncbi:MAG: hypothetical protein K7J46_22205 [Bryobacter sp.]|jgi:hypothetical protein|nr:hypothetical protein [Bryobacter sp. CoA8 C33]
MISDLETIGPIAEIANGITIGGELGFAFPDVLAAVKLCTANDIAVLGVEIFLVRGEAYETIKMSSYEIENQEWKAYVEANNALAEDFIGSNPSGDDQIYVLTTSSWREFCEIQNQKRAWR